jgi:hypothetical protein
MGFEILLFIATQPNKLLLLPQGWRLINHVHYGWATPARAGGAARLGTRRLLPQARGHLHAVLGHHRGESTPGLIEQRLESGRSSASEIEAPNMLAGLV